MQQIIATHRHYSDSAVSRRLYLALAAGFLVFLAGIRAPAEEYLEYEASASAGQPIDETASGDFLAEPSPLEAGPYEPAPCEAGVDCDCCAPAPLRPVSWISGPYFKAGVAFPLGSDLLKDESTGYALSGGLRQALGPELGGERLFFDLGGSYLSAFGATTRRLPGVQTTATRDFFGAVTDVETVTVADAFDATLVEIKRGSMHAALGWYWGAPLDDRNADPQIRLAARLGGRVGHVRGRFDEQRLKFPIVDQTIAAMYGKTDTFGGLFIGTEAILLQRDTPVGHIQWTLDGELANDWIEFEGFDKGSLGTASVLFGFMLSR